MRHPNHRLVKRHRSYTVEDVSRVLKVHKNTVREWIRRGLPICGDRRPTLVQGADLAEFLRARRLKNRVKCPIGHIYCVRCRAAKSPAGRMVDYVPTSPTLGNLVGLCPHCGVLIFRRVNPKKLAAICGDLDLRLPQGLEHINESFGPSVTSDFRSGSA